MLDGDRFSPARYGANNSILRARDNSFSHASVRVGWERLTAERRTRLAAALHIFAGRGQSDGELPGANDARLEHRVRSATAFKIAGTILRATYERWFLSRGARVDRVGYLMLQLNLCSVLIQTIQQHASLTYRLA